MNFVAQITPVGGGDPVVFCNTPDPLPMTGAQASLESIVQQDPLYGSLAQFLNYLGNDIFTETIEVARKVDDAGALFADPFAAAVWARSHLITIPRAGKIELIYTGSVAATFTFAYGTIVPIQITKFGGCTIFLRYTLKGTNLTRS